MSSTRGVRWLMWVDGTPPMSAATAEIRSSAKYQSWSTGPVDSSNAAVARRGTGRRRASSPPWPEERSGQLEQFGSEQGPGADELLQPCLRLRVEEAPIVATSIEVNTLKGFFASSATSTGRKAVETTGTELFDASRRS